MFRPGVAFLAVQALLILAALVLGQSHHIPAVVWLPLFVSTAALFVLWLTFCFSWGYEHNADLHHVAIAHKIAYVAVATLLSGQCCTVLGFLWEVGPWAR